MLVRMIKTIIIIVGASLIWACPAQADWKWGFLQLNCVKELGWFSAHRVEIWNLPSNGPYLTKGLEAGQQAVNAIHAQGFFDGDALQSRPFTCNIAPYNQPGWEASRDGFEVKVVGHYSKTPKGNGDFDLTDGVEILVNGTRVGEIGLGLRDIGAGTTAISVANDGVSLVATVCAVADKDLPDGQAEIHCEDHQLRPSAGTMRTGPEKP